MPIVMTDEINKALEACKLQRDAIALKIEALEAEDKPLRVTEKVLTKLLKAK